MRLITADYIFPISSAPIKNGVITIDDKGTILDVGEKLETQNSKLEKYQGIICPGFVNTHCHLELSYLKNQLKQKTGIVPFIQDVVKKRAAFNEEFKQQAIKTADLEMQKNGIVAVADIANTSDTLTIKKNSKIKYHTLVEAYDLNPLYAEVKFTEAINIYNQFKSSGMLASMVPHAPYTVSNVLFEKLSAFYSNNNLLFSIHNQESEAENMLFKDKKGDLLEMFNKLNIDMSWLKNQASSSFNYILEKMPKNCNSLFVHNTYTTQQDIHYLKSQIPNLKRIFFSTCPNANLFIENKLPDYPLFLKENINITIGTDSYASNWSLSVLDELKTINAHCPTISLNTLLTWATINGANFMNLSSYFGSIEKGKKPGLNLIKNIDKEALQLTLNSQIEALV